MSRMRITLVLVAVTLSTLGLNAQNNRLRDLNVDVIVDEAMAKLKSLDYNFSDFNQQRVIISRDNDAREISVTRRSKRITRRNNVWNRSWALDRYYPRRGTDNFVNVYLGLNNWLEDGDLPKSDQLYSLSPINSWYAGLNFDNISRLIGPIYMDWGVGVSMQDFSFENTRVNVQRENTGDPAAITFTEIADISGRKSKINVTYLNAHFVPTLSLGRGNGFRVGFGVYGGYRIGSHTKMKFDDINGEKQKDKIKDSFHINPFKYGFRGQVGWDFFDLFFNYDLTEFFDEDVNAPRLTPVTFGVIF
jgi:hypothetical protein